MIRGELVALRARRTDDVPVLHEELYNDPVDRALSDPEPWVPRPVELSTFAVLESTATTARFSVVELTDGEPLAGAATLWGIDHYNRSAHIGVLLRPGFRGRGLSTDVLSVLCRYAFTLLGLHRVALETLAGNAPMIAAARRSGFTHEGTLRASGWVNGAFSDEVLYGQLRDEWLSRSAAPTAGA